MIIIIVIPVCKRSNYDIHNNDLGAQMYIMKIRGSAQRLDSNSMDLSNYTNKGAARTAQPLIKSEHDLLPERERGTHTYTQARDAVYNISAIQIGARARGFDFGGLINKDGTYTCARRQTRAAASIWIKGAIIEPERIHTHSREYSALAQTHSERGRASSSTSAVCSHGERASERAQSGPDFFRW